MTMFSFTMYIRARATLTSQRTPSRMLRDQPSTDWAPERGALQQDHNTSVHNRWGMLTLTISTRRGLNILASSNYTRDHPEPNTGYKGGALPLRCQER